MHPDPTGPIRPPDGRDRAAGGAFRTGVPQCDELVVGDVGADLALGPFDPLLDLRQVLVDQHRPLHGLDQLAGCSTPLDVVLHRVRGTPGQLAGITQRPGQVVGIQDFHDLLSRLHFIPSSGRWGASAPLIAPEEGASTTDRGEADDVVSGRSQDRQRSVLMSACVQLRGRLRSVFPGRRHSAGKTPPAAVRNGASSNGGAAVVNSTRFGG